MFSVAQTHFINEDLRLIFYACLIKYTKRSDSCQKRHIQMNGKTADQLQVSNIDWQLANILNVTCCIGSSSLLVHRYIPKVRINVKYGLMSWSCTKNDIIETRLVIEFIGSSHLDWFIVDMVKTINEPEQMDNM